VFIKSADPVCKQMATAVGIPLRYKEEKLEDGDRKRERKRQRGREVSYSMTSIDAVI